MSARVEGGDSGVKLLIKFSHNIPQHFFRSSVGEREVSSTGGVFSWNQAVSTIGTLTLVPKSSLYLFEPTSAAVSFKGNCVEDAAKFIAEKVVLSSGTGLRASSLTGKSVRP